MKKKICGASWKMHKNTLEEVSYFCETVKEHPVFSTIEAFILPSFVFIPFVSEQLSSSKLGFGSQTIAFLEHGALTGEVSPTALLEFACKYVEIGHAERREHLNETNSIVNQKVKLALHYGMIPVVCIGENKQEKDSGVGDVVILEQIEWVCKDIEVSNLSKIIFAYEPVWAIGQQKGADSAYVEQQHSLIRRKLTDLSNETIAHNTRIIYGGSVNKENAKQFIQQKNIDGLFIGRFGLDPHQFIEIATIVAEN